MSELRIVVHASMSSLPNYCNFQISLFSCLNKAPRERLQVIHSTTVRVQTESLLIQLLQSALPLVGQIKVYHIISYHFKSMVLTFRALQGPEPTYICEF